MNLDYRIFSHSFLLNFCCINTIDPRLCERGYHIYSSYTYMSLLHKKKLGRIDALSILAMNSFP